MSKPRPYSTFEHHCRALLGPGDTYRTLLVEYDERSGETLWIEDRDTTKSFALDELPDADRRAVELYVMERHAEHIAEQGESGPYEDRSEDWDLINERKEDI